MDTKGESIASRTAATDAGYAIAVDHAFYTLHDACGDLDAVIRRAATAEEAIEIQRRIGDLIALLRSTARAARQHAADVKAPTA